jgi:hypothetical protein
MLMVAALNGLQTEATRVLFGAVNKRHRVNAKSHFLAQFVTRDR